MRDIPKNIEAEQVVLGSALLDPDEIVPMLVERFRPEHFYQRTHKVIFRTIRELFERGEPADIVTVANRLVEKGEMETAGGRLYLNELLDRVTTTASVEHYSEIVRKKATLRFLIEAGGRISELGYGEAEEADSQLDKAAEIFANLSKDGNGTSVAGGSTWGTLEAVIGPIEWAWPGWLPKGFLVLLAGDLGSGKSIVTLRIVASLIRGDDWPDGTPFQGETGSVLWAEAESAQAINLSRAKDWGLPLDRIRTPFEDPLTDIRLDDPTSMRRIRRAASDPEVRLVVVDSLSGSHRKDENTLEAGRIAQSLATLARDSGKPVVTCHHLTKPGANEIPEVTLKRVRGSTSIAQYARVVWGIDQPNLSQRDRRRLCQVKNNLGRFAPPIGFEIDKDGVQFVAAPSRPHIDSQVDRAADLLLALLRVKPHLASEIEHEAHEAGISGETMKRAKKRLGVASIHKNGRWVWSLPAPEKAPL